jgi:hypothetical protein
VSDANVTDESEGTVSEEAATQEPLIKVLKGNPTDDELAALVCVLASASDAQADAGPASRDMWGHPLDKLRYSFNSHQLVTSVARAHLRR